MCKRIWNLKIDPTRMILQLANRSITRLVRVVEDVLIKVHQLTFLMDFVIMDIEEDAEIPLILGRPFMVTAKCVVDMGKDNLEMSVEDQKATFNLFEGINHPKEDESKPVVNPTDSSSVFLGPKQVRARALDIPPMVPPPDVSPPLAGQTFMLFSQPKQLLPMLHSLHHGQYLLM
eukprot:XP_014628576.1 uncharacterized protein LOC106797847 [Glycine max]